MAKIVGGLLKYSLAATSCCGRMSSISLARRTFPPLKEARQLLQRRCLPGADLGRMGPILTGQLGQRLLFAQGRPDDLRLELRAVMLSHTVSLRFHVFSPTSLSKILRPL
jgi:hypothetical protein